MTRREGGYAMIAAVAAVAVFGYLSLAALKDGRSAVVAAGAAASQARLAADADAGVALAIHNLGLSDPTRRWSLVAPPRMLDFDGARLTIAIEDENGKAPINFLRADQLHRLFALGGADSRQVDGLTEALLDLRGDPRGPEGGGGAGFPRIDRRLDGQRGPLTSVAELTLLPGMTPALYARLAPAVTVHAVTLSFDPRTAPPLALAVMAPDLTNAPRGIDQTRARAGETPALAGLPPVVLAGRTVTVRVDADAGSAHLRRTAVVEFTGAAQRPYIMRGLE